MPQSENSPKHTAIIMDGNGRWASERGLPRLAGHRAGAAAFRRTLEAAPELGIRTLTMYAFSSDNWKRPRAEVSALMALLESHFRSESAECARKGVRLSMIGRRDRLPAAVVRAAAEAEETTSGGTSLHVRLAIDYSARDSIVHAIRHSGCLTREDLSGAIGEDVDLLIRTGGEQRLSDFLIWECAYAELIFTRGMWPDFDGADLRDAVATFQARERRFGGVAERAPLPQLWRRHEEGHIPNLRGDRWLR